MFKSKHIMLAPITEEDLPIMLEWINERNQVLFNSHYKPVTKKQHEDWFNAIQQRKDVVIFGVKLLETGKIIGSCQLYNINFIDRNAELRIRIGDINERGHGYGSEAIRLLLEFAFNDLNLHRVYVNSFSTNARAIQVYEKAGFKKEGTLRNAAYIDGRYIDIFVMGILRREVEKGYD